MTRVGRLREFDRDHALENAMELFWRQGYEGTTPAIAKALAEGESARMSVGNSLQAAVESFSTPANPRGCYLVLGAMNCGPSNRHIEDFMREQRALRERVIKQRLRRAVAEGDLARTADIGGIASFYSTLLDGLALGA